MIFNLLTLQADGGQGAGAMNLIMIVLLIAIFYFFMIRPQQKKQKEIRKFRDSISEGDRVVTAGGIYGKIRSINDNIVRPPMPLRTRTRSTKRQSNPPQS